MKVSIILPYDKPREWLDDAVRSVESQSYKNHELIISNGHGGVSANLNEGIKKATGDIIRYVCDDDMLTRDSLFHTVNLWPTGADFIHSNAVNFNSYDKTKRSAQFPKITNPTLNDMVQFNQLHGGSVSYKAKCFEQRGFDEELWTCEEYEFNMWLMSEGYRLGYVDAFTYLYRRHDNQKSIGNQSHDYQSKRSVVRRMVQLKYKQ